MGKASRKKTSARAGKPAGSNADMLTSPDKSKASYGGEPGDRETGGLLSKPIVHLLLIVLLGFLAYSNTFKSPFQWDESIFIAGNPIVKDLGFFAEPSRAAGLPVYDGFRSRYLGYLTFALNYRLHGLNVFGYHIVNFVIHIVNAILVYFFVLLTFKTPYFSNQRSENSRQNAVNSKQPSACSIPLTSYSRLFAFAVSLLFVAHPLQTEAVTYIFQRLASLVSMFYLLSLVLFIKGRLASRQADKLVSRESGTLLLSLVSAVLAMKTKENALTLPVIIVLYEFLFFSGPLKARALKLVPFLLTMLIVPMTIIGLDSSAGEIISQIKDPASLGYQELPGNAYLYTQFRVIVTYIRLLFFPVNQTIDYDYPIYHSMFDPPVLLSFLFLAVLFGMAVYLIYIERKRGSAEVKSQKSTYPLILNPYPRLIAFGILWFFITLSVESSIIPIPMVIDEYRTYLPSVGFFLAVIATGLLFVQRIGADTLKKEKMVIAAFVALSVIFAAATYARNTLWKDKVSLWEDVVAKSPNSPRGYNNLGIAYNEKGMNEKAIAMYKRCIELSPNQKDVHINLGIAYAMSGQIEESIKEFTKALAITPKNSVIFANLALAYTETGQFDRAAEIYVKAVELDPFNSSAYHGLGTSYMRVGRVDEALEAYTKFVSLSPRDPEAYRNRAIAYSEKGDLNSAREDFKKSCSLGSSQSCESLKRFQ